jgi:TrmH family RNA methyltransferase
MGSICRVNVQYRALHEFLPKYSKTEDVIVYGSSLEGKSIFDAPLSNKGIIVMGNESHGISEELLPYINTQLYIPNFSKISGNRAESLNVSVAAGIICSEFRKYQSAIQSGKKG